MVGFLGMMAAGAARGARDASNANTDAINKVEMIQMQGRANAQAEAVKQKYANMQFERNLAAKREDAAANREHDMAKLDKNAELTKEMNAQKIQGQMNLEGYKQKNRSALQAQKTKDAQSLSAKTGILGSAYKPMSSDGKIAMDLVNAGLAENMADAMDQVQERRMLGGIANNNFMQEPQQLMDFYGRYKGAKKGQQQPAASDELIREFNPKTGGFN